MESVSNEASNLRPHLLNDPFSSHTCTQACVLRQGVIHSFMAHLFCLYQSHFLSVFHLFITLSVFCHISVGCLDLSHYCLSHKHTCYHVGKLCLALCFLCSPKRCVVEASSGPCPASVTQQQNKGWEENGKGKEPGCFLHSSCWTSQCLSMRVRIFLSIQLQRKEYFCHRR